MKYFIQNNSYIFFNSIFIIFSSIIFQVGVIISFLSSVRYEHILIEIFDMLILYLQGKNCKDQMILLLYEPNTANLLYNFFIDKIYSENLHEIVIKFLDCLLSTSRVHQKYKQILRILDTENHSLYPGFFSYLIPLNLNSNIILHLLDQILLSDIDYCGLLFLVYHVSLSDINLKLEVSKRLLSITFDNKYNASVQIAKQVSKIMKNKYTRIETFFLKLTLIKSLTIMEKYQN